MKRAVLVVAVSVLVCAGCKPKKKDAEGDKGGMQPAAMTAMEPAGDMGGMAPAGDMGGMGTAPAAGDATAEFDKILALNKKLAKVMEGIKTLDDLKKQRPDYVKLNIEILKLTLVSLRKAVKLSPDQLKAYVAKQKAMNKANAEFGKNMMAMQKRIMKIEGAQKFIAATQKELAEKLKPLTKEMTELTKIFMKKVMPKANKGGDKVPPRPAPTK